MVVVFVVVVEEELEELLRVDFEEVVEELLLVDFEEVVVRVVDEDEEDEYDVEEDEEDVEEEDDVVVLEWPAGARGWIAYSKPIVDITTTATMIAARNFLLANSPLWSDTFIRI